MGLSGVRERLQPMARWMTSHWAGRVVLATVAEFRRLEPFDRAMALGAQLFTSVVPILIMLAVWVGESASQRFASAVTMPSAAAEILDQALDEPGGTAFGVIGSLFVLISATSLSRALARSMATIWLLPRPKTSLRSAWRWIAVVIALALSVVVARALGLLTDALPPRHTWTLVITFVLDALGAVFLPWLLLAGKVSVRRLVPGAILFALVLLAGRPVARAFLPDALEESADRYGSIGVAFTYIALLYAVALAFLGTMIVGRVIAEDQGRLGQYFRRGGTTPGVEQPALSAEPTDSGEATDSGDPTRPAAPSGSADPESTANSY